ncbi:glycosyltransferase [Lentzea xinjiangensis]|uniref:glycosyltransferase n=1 Tax=Lentzea xinjiangensis TaxID=402600 RepID=UPI0015A66E53|nr:glycosyltransferase [Lentzea xinjiangensis]
MTALVTAYHPDDRLAAVVESALVTCSEVIVSDNTPSTSASAAEKLDDPRVTVLRNGSNLGLAAALNSAVGELPADTDVVLFLDQDSVLPPDLVPSLAAHFADASVGVVAPTPWDATHGESYEKAARSGPALADRDGVMTSGMLVRRSCLTAVGRFREDFFVDWVDFDFCLRTREHGFRVVQDTTVLLPHSLGDRREHKVGPLRVHVLHYPAWRHYWVARNSTVLAREHRAKNWRWSLSAALFLARWTVNTAVFERQRRTHVPALLAGFRDGWTGRARQEYVPAGAQYSAAR